MNKVPKALQDKLLDYLDGKLGAEEQQEMKSLLQKDAILRACFEDFKNLDKALRTTTLEQPSKNFTQVVMSGLSQYVAPSKLSIRNGLLLLMGVLIVIGAASLLVAGGVFDQTTTIDMNQIDLPKKYINYPMPSVSVDGKLIVNIIIVLNLGLAWMVLDRLILKPFFQRRLQSEV